jgi:hypothetical protein
MIKYCILTFSTFTWTRHDCLVSFYKITFSMSMSVSSVAYDGSLWYVELLYKSTYVRAVCIVLLRAVCKKNDAHGSVSVLCANVEVRHRIICCMSKNKCKIIFQNFNVNKCNNVMFNHIAFLHTLRGD